MKRSRFSNKQVPGIFQEHEAGAKCADLCRKHGMSEGRFYAWKPKYSGMDVPDARPSAPVHDQFSSGQRFRILNIMDDVTRECLAVIPDISISGKRVVQERTTFIERRGKPGMSVSPSHGLETNHCRAMENATE